VRTPLTRTVRNQFLLPAGLLAVAALSSFAMFVPATSAGASGRNDASKVTNVPANIAKACGPVNTKGVSPRANSGNPFTSTNRH
jgi:hypothetical protein